MGVGWRSWVGTEPFSVFACNFLLRYANQYHVSSDGPLSLLRAHMSLYLFANIPCLFHPDIRLGFSPDEVVTKHVTQPSCEIWCTFFEFATNVLLYNALIAIFNFVILYFNQSFNTFIVLLYTCICLLGFGILWCPLLIFIFYLWCEKHIYTPSLPIFLAVLKLNLYALMFIARLYFEHWAFLQCSTVK